MMCPGLHYGGGGSGFYIYFRLNCVIKNSIAIIIRIIIIHFYATISGSATQQCRKPEKYSENNLINNRSTIIIFFPKPILKTV